MKEEYWRRKILKFLRWNNPDSGYSFVLNQGGGKDVRRTLEVSLSVDPPDSLVSLYEAINGFGIKWKSEEVVWMIPPYNMLSDAIKYARYWFSSTHPEIAESFFAIVNWGDGDYDGFMRCNDLKWLDSKIYHFDHEMYFFDVDQNWNDFIVESAMSLESLFDVE